MVAPSRKTRFAPSPTGLLHLGNVRTALFNYLLAQGSGGSFMLRIEDTDAARGHERFAVALQDDLQWLGLVWQEGPGVGGAQDSYFQSQRGAVYDRYFQSLEAQGLAYACFCSDTELAVARRAQLAAGHPPRYGGRCRALTPEQAQARLAAGEKATLRFRVPDGETVEFEDRVRGPQRFATDDIGDFVIRRSDGTPAFFFSNAVDDALMDVSLVVRGEDHLTNTPRQILLMRALNLHVPEYAHIALVVGADGAPLSKRTGSRSVQELRALGYLPLAVNNYLARVGHTYESNELMDMARLAADFNLDRLHRAPAHYDEAQLNHWQKLAILQASDEQLWDWARTGSNASQSLETQVPKGLELKFMHAVRDNISAPADVQRWAVRLFGQEDRFDAEALEALRSAGSSFLEAALASLTSEAGDFRSYAQAVGRATGAKGKALFMPLRAAMTGLTHGPEMERIWSVLGIERVRAHLESARRSL